MDLIPSFYLKITYLYLPYYLKMHSCTMLITKTSYVLTTHDFDVWSSLSMLESAIILVRLFYPNMFFFQTFEIVVFKTELTLPTLPIILNIVIIKWWYRKIYDISCIKLTKFQKDKKIISNLTVNCEREYGGVYFFTHQH